MDTDKHRSRNRSPQTVCPALVSGPAHLCGSVSRCGSNRFRAQRGTVILITLCFVTVLGIMLAGYIALCSRAMQLSNRSFQAGLSKQLAEAGIEEALRAFNKNLLSGTDTTAALADWTSGGITTNWTLDPANKRATATMTFPSTKFAQGVTASVKIRVDNYDANTLDSAWNSSTAYRADNVVGYTDGRWYRSTNIQSGKTPSTASGYWIQEHISPMNSATSTTWMNGISYAAGNMTTRNGAFYRCISAHTSSSANSPPNATYWLSIPYVTFGSDLQYSTESMVFWLNATWYRWTGSTWLTSGSGMPPRWLYNSGTTYYAGDLVRSGTTWYRYINSTPSSGGALSDTTYWNTATSLATSAAANWNWSSSANYNIGDVTYYSSRWYRARVANTNQTPGTTSAYWSAYPLLGQTWDSSRQYGQYNTVYYNGVWYLSLSGTNNYGQNPSTATSYWIGADTTNTSYLWNSTTAYAANAYRCYDGVWYKCLVGNTGQTPNNTTYWTPTWSQSSGVTTGAPVAYAEATVNLGDNTTSVSQLRATIEPAALFPNALAAAQTITLSGGSATIDSYDSVTDPNAITPGYAAVLAAGATSGTALTIGNGTNVKGYVAAYSSSSSPYAPLASFGSSATVKGASSPITPNVDTSRVSRSPYIPDFDILSVPSYTTLADIDTLSTSQKTLGTAGATTPLVLTYAANLDLNDADDILTIIGPVVLNVQGSLRINNPNAKITIAETGSLRIHVSGRLRLDSGGGGIVNETKDPKKCVILSTATTNDHNFSTSQYFYGVIYMPDEDLNIDAATATIFGAISARNITVTGNLNLHYDTSLRYATFSGVDQPYTVTSWSELAASEQATMP